MENVLFIEVKNELINIAHIAYIKEVVEDEYKENAMHYTQHYNLILSNKCEISLEKKEFENLKKLLDANGKILK